MKKFIISLVLILFFFSGYSQIQYSLKGKIKKSKTRKVWIYNYNKSISDTVRLNIFRRFKYTNSFLENELCFVKPIESETPIVFTVDSVSKLKFKTSLPDIHSNLSVVGNLETSTANEFFSGMNQYQNKIKETETKLYTEETADGQYYFDSLLKTILEEKMIYKTKFVEENQDVPSLLLINDFLDYENDYELLLKVEEGLKSNFSSTEMYEKVKLGIHKYQMFHTKVEGTGEKAPMLIMPGKDGKDVSMEDLKGNYILIDFWASWCKPCRAEHPRLIRLYEKYKEQGFEIYSISLDKSKEKWIKAIEKDQLTWVSHVSNLKMFNCPSVEMFDIQSLPSNVLVDRQGNIIDLNLRGEKLENKLKLLFYENN